MFVQSGHMRPTLIDVSLVSLTMGGHNVPCTRANAATFNGEFFIAANNINGVGKSDQ